MPLLFQLRDFGRAFATREKGAELRDRLLSSSSDESLVVDFADVTNVSYSFADEFLGVLASDEAHPRLIEPVNMSAPVDRIVRHALARRRGEPVVC
jgi:hypothetical protein